MNLSKLLLILGLTSIVLMGTYAQQEEGTQNIENNDPEDGEADLEAEEYAKRLEETLKLIDPEDKQVFTYKQYKQIFIYTILGLPSELGELNQEQQEERDGHVEAVDKIVTDYLRITRESQLVFTLNDFEEDMTDGKFEKFALAVQEQASKRYDEELEKYEELKKEMGINNDL